MRSPIAAFGRLLGRSSRSLNVAVVAPQIIPFDGTSNAVRDTIRAVSAVANWRVSVFARTVSVEGLPVQQVESADDLARQGPFRSADAVIYHFGFYDELFDVLRDGQSRARQFVLFHNITPAEHMADRFRPLIARSFEQLQYFRDFDRFLPFSSTNAEVLIGAGFDASRIVVVNPVIEWPSPWLAARKAVRPIEILFVGRMTKSKGVMDLLDAVESLRTECTVPFHVTLVGGQVEQEYIDAVRERSSAMAPLVEFVGRCGKDELEARYRAAHILAIPSYHEGFCRPVAEGLRSGCIPVGYASYHVPIVANRLGRLTEPGDIQALAGALKSTIEGVHQALANPAAARCCSTAARQAWRNSMRSRASMSGNSASNVSPIPCLGRSGAFARSIGISGNEDRRIRPRSCGRGVGSLPCLSRPHGDRPRHRRKSAPPHW